MRVVKLYRSIPFVYDENDGLLKWIKSARCQTFGVWARRPGTTSEMTVEVVAPVVTCGERGMRDGGMGDGGWGMGNENLAAWRPGYGTW